MTSPVNGQQLSSQPDQPIAVFLLDAHEVVRRGVKDLLEADPGIRVVGEAGTVASALARIPALRPDVAVLDVRLPDGPGRPAGRCNGQGRSAAGQPRYRRDHRDHRSDADLP